MEVRNEMQDFAYCVPTQLYFGRTALDHLYESIEKWSPKKRLLLVYGGGSIKRMGLYDKVVKILKDNGVFFAEISGVQPNPKMGLVREGVKICHENDIDIVLAVGGGSASDTAKAIATAAVYDGDVAELVGQWWLKPVLPVFVISTSSGAGSEISTSTVLTNEETNVKQGFHGPEIRPKVTFLDPEYTMTVPPQLTAAGIIDGISHTLESYFSQIDGAYIHARLGEAIIKTLVEWGPIAYAEPNNYSARANVMMACMWANNGLIVKGNYAMWICHVIEHQFSAYNDLTHGVGLAIITPKVLRWFLKDEEHAFRFVDLGVNVFGMDPKMDKMEMANKVIDKFEDIFYNVYKMPKTFKEVGFDDKAMEFIEKRLSAIPTNKVFQATVYRSPMTAEDLHKVLWECYEG